MIRTPLCPPLPLFGSSCGVVVASIGVMRRMAVAGMVQPVPPRLVSSSFLGGHLLNWVPGQVSGGHAPLVPKTLARVEGQLNVTVSIEDGSGGACSSGWIMGNQA